jgi:hypothetical protein
MTRNGNHRSRSGRPMTGWASAGALGAIVLAAGLAGCDQGTDAPATGVHRVSWLVSQPPGPAAGVRQTLVSAKEGQAVVVHGRIGGRSEPLNARSPVFTIIDLSLEACAGCADACSVSPEELRGNIASVMIVDAEGRAVKDNPIAAGLKAQDEVIVAGTVAPGSGDGSLIIMATSIHRMTR